jgi:hypothetical protein
MCQDAEATVPPDIMVEGLAMEGQFIILIPAEMDSRKPPLTHS